MTISLDRVFSSLDDMEQIQLELEAEARGVCVRRVVLEILRDGLAEECKAEAFQHTDSQWKSH